jgi:hypothetical protein
MTAQPSKDEGFLRRDLNATIAHVVGQGVVALASGCEFHFAVDPHPSGQFFEGVCWVRNPSGEMPGHVKRPVALAGLIAQMALLRGSPQHVEAVDVFNKLQSGDLALSAADRDMADGFTLSDVAFALDVLRDRWHLVEQEIVSMAPKILQHPKPHFH